jgi:hypothetical protein
VFWLSKEIPSFFFLIVQNLLFSVFIPRLSVEFLEWTLIVICRILFLPVFFCIPTLLVSASASAFSFYTCTTRKL